MISENKTIFSVLNAIRDQLVSIASYAHLNAILSHGDPALLLPSPAVGLMEFHSDRSVELPPGSFCRSVQPLGPFGEVTLSPIAAGVMIHPWKITSAQWITPEVNSKKDRARPDGITGIRMVISRDKTTTCSTGWMSLLFEGATATACSSFQLRATSESQSLEMQPAVLPSQICEVQPHEPGIIHYHLMSLIEGLHLVNLPVSTYKRTGIEVEIWFSEEVPSSMVPEFPSVRCNVFPVWNSLTCQYPTFDRVEQWTAESESRRLHSLNDSNLGPEWVAWSLVSDERASQLATGDFGSVEHVKSTGLAPRTDGYRLCFTPPANANSSAETNEGHGRWVQPTLSVLLGNDLRDQLDAKGEKFRVKYRSTTGASANGIPDGSEFELLSDNGTTFASRVSGKLVGCTWGGSDSFALTELQTDMQRLWSYVRLNQPRTIADVSEIVSSKFGQFMELVDEADLLTTDMEGSVHDLLVRIRFLKTELSDCERLRILRSCELFLAKYLSPFLGMRIVLVDIESDHGDR